MDKRGKVEIFGVLVMLVMLSALVPTIQTFATTLASNASNPTEAILYGLVTLFLAIGIIYDVIVSFGLNKAKM